MKINFRVVLIVALVVSSLFGLVLFMYPRLLNQMGIKFFGGKGRETFEPVIVTDAQTNVDGEADEEDDDDEGESDEEDDEGGSTEDDEDDEEFETDDEVSEADTEEDAKENDDDNEDGVDGDGDDGTEIETYAPLPTWAPPRTVRKATVIPAKRLVVFHATWCGHCKRLLAPEGAWQQVKTALPGVTIEEIDESENAALVKSLGVTSFPHIMVIDSANSHATSYDGPRTAKSIVDFALSNITPDEI